MPNVLRGELVAPEPNLFDRAKLCASGFLAGYGNAGTRRNYTESLTYWVRFLEQHRLTPFEVQRPHLELWARTMEDQGLKPATVSNRLIAVCGYYRYATQEGYIDRDPGAHVRRPKVDMESSTEGLDRSEMGKLIIAARNHSPRSFALVSLLSYNGLRISEALGIDLEHFGEERGHRVIHIMGKGSKPARVPVAPPLGRALDAYIAGRTAGPLFLTRQNQRWQRMSRYAAANMITRLAVKAGISKHISPHSLRHSAITAALDAGVDLRDAQIFARHADPRTTTRYDRARDNLDRNATYSVARFVAGAA